MFVYLEFETECNTTIIWVRINLIMHRKVSYQTSTYLFFLIVQMTISLTWKGSNRPVPLAQE